MISQEEGKKVDLAEEDPEEHDKDVKDGVVQAEEDPEEHDKDIKDGVVPAEEAPLDSSSPDDIDKTAAELLENDIPWKERYKQVFVTYLPLGFISFGGPQAHTAILRDTLVVQKKWLDDEQFTELFAIGQGLPGPTSTQLVVSTALARAGPIGGITAFILFNLPGLVALTTCGVLISTFVDPNNTPWYLVGLPPAAISLVFQAFYGFGE
jgi:chromate transporter